MEQSLSVLVTKEKMGEFELGRLTLDRSRSLNALSLKMFKTMIAVLEEWENDSKVVAVWLDSNSDRAFCAGGDVKSVAQDLEGTYGIDSAKEYFSYEYYADFLIRTYEKPIICWAHGITMGGGIGLMNGCSHRVVTETSLLSMPEVNIGFFPDVGSSLFLNQLPKGVGLFMGLTAARLDGADSLSVSLADFYMEHSHKKAVMEGLCALNWSSSDGERNRRLIEDYLRPMSEDSVVGKAAIMDRLGEIQELMDQDNLKDVDSVLRDWEPHDEYFKACKHTYEEGCPTSVSVFYELMKSPPKDVREVYLREWNVALGFCEEGDNFIEGVRAVLVDKDNDPRWKPGKLSRVPNVSTFFEDKSYPNGLRELMKVKNRI